MRRSGRRREIGRFLKFSVVGAVGAVVDFGTFNLLHARFGFPEVPSSMISFTAAVTSNFIWNRVWTYPDSRSKSVRQQALQFTLVSLIGLAIRTPTFALLLAPCTRLAETLLEGSPALAGLTNPDTLGSNMALAAAVILVLFWNFFVNRYWTYADVDLEPGEATPQEVSAPPV
jgi:putative flippase GtrA